MSAKRTGDFGAAAGRRRSPGRIALVVAGLWLAAAAAQAGTTGKLSGRVTDSKQQALVGANVVLLGHALGAYAGADGHYDVLNIPPGTYDVSFSYVGCQTEVVKGIVISSDLTTRQDVQLEQANVRLSEVVVKAERPVVDVNLTSSRATLTRQDIASLPVQELQDVVNLQAGVVDGHFRGGRKDEVQYQIDGVSANNAYDNTSALRIDRSLLQEVQVISGTFDAEYGQAMSGVVNAVLRDGTSKFQWSGEAYSGGYVFPGSSSRLIDDGVRPAAVRNFQLTLSGPLAAGATYLVSARRYLADDFLRGTRRFRPTDRSDFEKHVFTGTGDNANVALGWSREWSGAVRIGLSPFSHVKMNYDFLYNFIRARRADWAYHLDPEGLPRQKTDVLVHGLDVTHTLGKLTYYTLSLRQTWWDYWDTAYTSAWDPAYDAAGPPVADPNFENGDYVQGVDLNRFHQKTNTLLFKGSLVSQVSPIHHVKIGLEFERPEVQFGNPEYLVFSTVNDSVRMVRYHDQPPDFPGVQVYYPRIGSAYAQDQIEWLDLTLRGGLRLDYFDAHTFVPSDPANPTNSIAGAPLSHLRWTSRKAALSPRLGVAYPISEAAGLHFAYGHFYQFPAIRDAFGNANYGVLHDLQAGSIRYGVLGNPDIRPERTIQYEFGFKYALTPDLGSDVTFFYKDIRDLLGVEFIALYNAAQYARLTNVDFGSVIGFTLSLDQRQWGPFSASLGYTWQRAMGNSSDPYETAVRASAGQDPRPRQVPLNWDQRHTLNLTAALSKPRMYSVSAVVRAASGQPYTPILQAGFGTDLEANSGRKPAGLVVDLRAEKPLWVSRLPAQIFLRIFNLFDTRFFNGFVFESTGSPYYSRFPVTDAAGLADPSRFYPPRRIELGIDLNDLGDGS